MKPAKPACGCTRADLQALSFAELKRTATATTKPTLKKPNPDRSPPSVQEKTHFRLDHPAAASTSPRVMRTSASNRPSHDHRNQPLKCARPAAGLRAATNRRKALKLRLDGNTFRQIGQALGVSPATAHGYVNDAWHRLNKQTDRLRRKLRTQELAQMEARLKELMAIIEQDHLRPLDPALGSNGPCEINGADFEKQLAATDEVLRIHDRQRVLFGLPPLDPEDAATDPDLAISALPGV